MAIVQQRRAVTASIPSPIGGWNARDSLAAMPVTDAVTLTNFYPTPTEITIRRGWIKHSTGITGRVITLMNYAGVSSQKLFACAGNKIWDVDGPVALPVFNSLDNRFSFVNFNNDGGDYMVACNGEESLVYDGTLWARMAPTNTAALIDTATNVGRLVTITTKTPHGLVTKNAVEMQELLPSNYDGKFVITVVNPTTFTYELPADPPSAPTHQGKYSVYYGVTGINPNKFIQVNLFKNRLYFVEKNSLDAWYLPVDAIGGEAKPIRLGGVATQGGFLQAMGTWTIDAGQGADDYAVWATNMGEVMVYNGTDPDSPDSWELKGVWQFGFVFSRRCFYKWGGDLLLLSQDGLVPLAASLQSSRLDPRVFLTDKIFYAIAQQVERYSTEQGWQMIYFARANMLMINIPATSGRQQYVMHTISKAWANFTAIDADCWELNNDNLFFGGNGYVGRFWETFADDGKEVAATCQQAYSYFDAPGQQKRFTLIRPTFFVDVGQPGLYAGINTDFQTQNNLGKVTFKPTQANIGIWDSSKWDQCVWSGGLVTYNEWQGVTGIGYCAGINLNMVSKGIDVRWTSTDYVMERGSVI